MKKKILIIGAGVLQVPAIVKAKQMGLEVIALDIDPNAPGFKIADESIQISTLNIDGVLEKALEIRPNAIVTLASDMPIRTVSYVSNVLNLNNISFETALNATDKGKMRNILKKKKIPIPYYFVVSSIEQYLEAVKCLVGKFIVKPADSSGSRGIILVENYNKVEEAYLYAREQSRSGEVIVEEYMVGPEVSVETLTIDGETNVIAITDKLTTGAPHFVEMGHSIPSQLTEDVQIEIRKVVIAAVEAIGIDIGPSHTEVIVTTEGPKIVELGARLGGDNITTHLVPLATGVDMVEITIRLALGEKVEISQPNSNAAAIRYLKARENGILKSISVTNDIRKYEGVKDIVFTKSIGDVISKINNSNDRIGYVISQAKTANDAITICERALKSMKIAIN